MDYSHNNFEIGTKDNVKVSTEVSCCITMVSLRAVDLTGEEYNSDFMEGAGAGKINYLHYGYSQNTDTLVITQFGDD